MKNSVSDSEPVGIPPFDFENSEPNKFAERYDEHAETVIYKSENARGVILDQDVAEYFPDSESVNIALRALISVISKIRSLPARPAVAAYQKRLRHQRLGPLLGRTGSRSESGYDSDSGGNIAAT
ncbi:hypothetical protein QUF80_22530 [Desulfococcaceae bacterium HSG8]|nr:hypothetical protein [Desulfococcaceae bacterium HSG8]